jgi:hypothetical protein
MKGMNVLDKIWQNIKKMFENEPFFQYVSFEILDKTLPITFNVVSYRDYGVVKADIKTIYRHPSEFIDELKESMMLDMRLAQLYEHCPDLKNRKEEEIAEIMTATALLHEIGHIEHRYRDEIDFKNAVWELSKFQRDWYDKLISMGFTPDEDGSIIHENLPREIDLQYHKEYYETHSEKTADLFSYQHIMKYVDLYLSKENINDLENNRAFA